MWKQRILTVMVALAAITAGCKPPAALAPLGGTQPDAEPTSVGATRQTLGDPRVLSGVIAFPGERQTQATAADVVNAATLQLIDPTTNMTVIGGVMSNGGSGTQTFSLAIPLTFQPSTGQVFMLEAIKGLNNTRPGNEAVRLRTFVQWTAGGWTSTTGSSTIAITAMTTAVSLISSIDPGNVPPAQTIGDVTYNLGTSTFTGSLPGHTGAEVTNLTRSVNDYIAGNVDPVANTSRLTPQVTGLSVARGAVGDVVAVYGDGFSPITGAATVSFNGANVGTYVVRSRTAMYVVVPTGATTGNVTVTTLGGTSNGLPFTVSTPGATTISPVVTGLSRTVVRRGDTLTLTGYNFDGNYSLNTVTLNGSIDLPVINGSPSFLTVTIPNNAVSGAIRVTNVNGPSGAWYLGVLTSTTQSIVEEFTNAATKDTAITTLDWSTTGTLGYPALVDWKQQGADFSAVTTAGATMDTFVNTWPKGGGVGIRRSVANTSFIQTGDTYPYGLPTNGGGMATNGDILVGIESNVLYATKIKNLRDISNEWTTQTLGYPFANVSNSAYLGMAGLQGSDVFYYVNGYGQASINSLKRFRINDYGVARMADITLPITINRYSTYSYGFRIGSDGTYILIWAGQGTGYSTSSSYFYRFAMNGDTATLIEARPVSPSYWPQDTSTYHYLSGDDMHYHMTGFDGTYPRTQMLNLTGSVYTTGFNLPFRGSSFYYYNYLVYDAKNDCYWATNPSQVGSYVMRLVRTGAYATTQGINSVTSPAIALPAGQVWDQLAVTGEEAPQTAIKFEVLNGTTNAVLYTSPDMPSGTINQTLNVRSALAGYTGSVKLRAWLDTTTANNTPYLTSWRITSAWGSQPLAQSNAYDTRVTSGAVNYQSFTVDQPAGAPAITVMFSDSPDGNTWSAWTPNLTSLSKRYVRWQITPSVASAYSGQLAERLQIDYQY